MKLKVGWGVMDLIYRMSKRFIIGSIVLLCVVAPFCGWFGAHIYEEGRYQSSNQVEPVYIEKVINEYLFENPTYHIDNIKFISVKKYEDNWYLATVESGGLKYKAVLADFGSLQVIVRPGELPAQKNISHLGIPYEIIDVIIKEAYDGSI